jgi:SAM-dependent methyltransferase
LSFKDHFSGHARSYAAYRPTYPQALIDFVVECCEQRENAWDCATGNGQTALALTRHVSRVIATDASAAQIESARQHPKVEYHVAAAEKSGLPDQSADLITVSQALHWFDLERFFDEAVRVLAPGGVLAAWSYELCTVEPDADALVLALYRMIDSYWPPERRMVEDGYQSLVFPMRAIAAPNFEMTAEWSVDAMLGYLRTWSACRLYLEDRGIDPVVSIEDALRSAWGPTSREVRWPIAVKAGRV